VPPLALEEQISACVLGRGEERLRVGYPRDVEIDLERLIASAQQVQHPERPLHYHPVELERAVPAPPPPHTHTQCTHSAAPSERGKRGTHTVKRREERVGPTQCSAVSERRAW
jgi:hypothetical protein